MAKTVLENKWPVYTNKPTENLKFPMIFFDYYLEQILKLAFCSKGGIIGAG